MTGRLEAIVTGTVDVGESSRVVRLLTPDEGRVGAIARGARGVQGKLVGVFEPGTRLFATVARGRGGDLLHLRGVDVISAPRRARQDFDRLMLLAYGCEFAASLAPEHHEAVKLFGLLGALLDRLEGEAGVGDATRQAFEGKALTFAGLAPALVRCARCQDALDDPCVFDPASGGAVHARCGGGGRFDRATGERLDALRRTPLAEAERVGGCEPRWLLADFARWHHHGATRSRAVLESLPR